MEAYYITNGDLDQKPKEFVVSTKELDGHIHFHMHFDYERLDSQMMRLTLGGESFKDGNKTTVGYLFDDIVYYFEVDGDYTITYNINKDYIEGVLSPREIHEEDGWVNLEVKQKFYSTESFKLEERE